MKTFNTLVSLFLSLILLLTPTLVYAGPVADGWNAGFQAGQQMVAAAGAAVNGMLQAAAQGVGAILHAGWHLVTAVGHAIWNTTVAVFQWGVKLVKKAVKFIDKVITGVLNGLVKLYEGTKKFFKMLIDAYMAGYNSIPCPSAGRMKQIQSGDFEQSMGELVAKHREARSAYVKGDKTYKQKFAEAEKHQRVVLKKAVDSLDKGDFFEYLALAETVKKLRTSKGGDFDASDTLAFQPVFDGLEEALRHRALTFEGDKAKLMKEMLEETQYNRGFTTSVANKFYKKGAVEIPRLR